MGTCIAIIVYVEDNSTYADETLQGPLDYTSNLARGRSPTSFEHTQLNKAESKQKLEFLRRERSFNEKLVAFLVPTLLGTWCMLFELFTLAKEAKLRDGWDEMGLWGEKGIAYAGVVARGVAEGFIAQGVFALIARAVEERRARGSWAAVVGVFGRS